MRRTDFEETLHGQPVADPCRWLENANSADMQTWGNAQSQFARADLDKLPVREALAARVAQLSAVTRGGTATEAGGRLFYLRQDPSDNQPILYITSGSGPARVLLNPTLLSAKRRFRRSA